MEAKVTAKVRPVRRKLKLLWLGVKVGVYASTAIVFAYAIVAGFEVAKDTAGQLTEEAKAAAVERFGLREVVVKVAKPEELDTEEIIEAISAEFGVAPIVTKAMALQESGGWERADRVRFEPHLHGKFKTPAGLNEIEKQFYASSFGLLQVIWGYHGEGTCGLSSYSQLLDVSTNIRCGLTVLTNNLKDVKGTPGQRLRVALRKYNGSGPDAEAYATKVMARIAELSYGDLLQER
jgi:soluble lytic murein transglycosylase-like protein